MRYIRHVPTDTTFRTVAKAAEHFEMPISSIIKDRVNFRWITGKDLFPIRLKQNNRVFESIWDASKELKIPQKHIEKALLSKRAVKSYTFEYADEPEKSPEPPRVIRKRGYTRSVICDDTGREFRSVADAARSMGLPPDGISKVLNGYRPHCGGFYFMWGTKNHRIRTGRPRKRLTLHNDLFGPIQNG